ncbi:MAG: hypothetical protein WA807_04615 [Steroidobacteraceae bacterium]
MAATRRAGVCDRFLIGLVAITLVRAGEALAGDQAPEAGARVKLEPNDLRQSTELPASTFGAPGKYSLSATPEANAFFPEEFRPRGHSVFESDTRSGIAEDRLISDTPVWQRLSEFRTHDRIRVLTLWKSGLSSVSLQAGKKGNPILQWTSRMMNSGEGADGLLDRLLPASSVGGRVASEGGRGMAHAGIAQPLAKGEPAGKAAALVGAGRTSLP